MQPKESPPVGHSKDENHLGIGFCVLHLRNLKMLLLMFLHLKKN